MLCRLARLAPSVARVYRGLPARAVSSITVSKKLLKAVATEIEHEQSTYSIDESFQLFLDKSSFSLSEKEFSSQVTLTKQTDDHSVEVTFLARTLDSKGFEGEYQGNPFGNYLDFQVAVQKKSSSGALLLMCISEQSEVSVVGLMHTKDLKALDRTNIYQQNSEYRGPVLNTSDTFQGCVLEYLESLGVDHELAEFLESYSVDKEQRLYMEWLSNIEHFLTK
jgi:complement component 1 Q subcomponent-binding protein